MIVNSKTKDFTRLSALDDQGELIGYLKVINTSRLIGWQLMSKADGSWSTDTQEVPLASLWVRDPVTGDRHPFNHVASARENAVVGGLVDDSPEQRIVCVRHRDGWCATRKKTIRYSDHVKTVCGMYVTGPLGIEWRNPDCPECLKRLGLSEPRR